MRFQKMSRLAALASSLLLLIATPAAHAGVFDDVKGLNEAVKDRTAVAKDIEKTTEDVKSLGPETTVKKKSKKKMKNDAADEASGVEWHVSSDGKPTGPFTAAQVGEYISSGKVDSDTLVWREGMSKWKEAGRTKELDKYFARKPPPLPGR